MAYNWGEGQQGGNVRSPNAPVQPNWAETSGALSFLASGLAKTQADYETAQKTKMEQMKIQAEAEKARTMAESYARVQELQNQGTLKQTYLKSMMDGVPDASVDPEGHKAALQEIQRFITQEKLMPEKFVMQDPNLGKYEAAWKRIESRDYSDFVGADDNTIRKQLEARYRDPVKASKVFNDYKAWLKEPKKKQPGTSTSVAGATTPEQLSNMPSYFGTFPFQSTPGFQATPEMNRRMAAGPSTGFPGFGGTQGMEEPDAGELFKKLYGR